MGIVTNIFLIHRQIFETSTLRACVRLLLIAFTDLQWNHKSDLVKFSIFMWNSDYKITVGLFNYNACARRWTYEVNMDCAAVLAGFSKFLSECRIGPQCKARGSLVSRTFVSCSQLFPKTSVTPWRKSRLITAAPILERHYLSIAIYEKNWQKMSQIPWNFTTWKY